MADKELAMQKKKKYQMLIFNYDIYLFYPYSVWDG